MKKGISILSLSLIVGAIIIVVLLIVFIFGNKSNTNNNTLNNTNINESTNYEVTSDGAKVNTSEEVASTQKVGNILIEKSSIIYENGMSKLTSKVTNDSVAKENLRFTIKFIGNDGKVIAQSIGLAGKIGANQTKYIDSNVTDDVTNAKSIVYEILE